MARTAGAYPAFRGVRDKTILSRMLVQVPPAMCLRYTFVHIGGERRCEGFWERNQHDCIGDKLNTEGKFFEKLHKSQK